MTLLLLSPLMVHAAVDYTAAHALRKKLSGSVSNTRIMPTWAPDSSAVYFQQNGTVLRTDTATGHTESVIKSGQLSPFFSETEPRIRRFEIAADGSFICLVGTENHIRTMRISGSSIEALDASADPFSLVPRRMTPGTKSGTANGDTTLLFINDTDQTVDIHWINGSGGTKKYATLNPYETHLQNTYAGHVFSAGKLAFTATSKPAVAYLSARPVPSAEPKQSAKAWKAEFKNHNLFLINTSTGASRQLTTDGSKDWKYCGPALESPDGLHLVVFREKSGTNRRITLTETAPDHQLQPRTDSILYPKPGDDLNIRKPHLFNLKTGTEIPLDDTLYPNPWNLSDFYWAPEGDRFFFLYNERGHRTLRLLAVQVATGKTATLIEEISPTFIDYSQKTYIRQLEESDEVLWMSERSGWNHLYLINRKTGTCKAVTSGEWVVRKVEHIDPEKRQIWFQAIGIYPGQDPYYIHHARINFDGSDPVLLTEANGTHRISFSKDRKFYIDTWSRVDQPHIHELHRSSDGRIITELGKADATKLLRLHPHLPEPFAAKGRDGETDIFGVIYRPTHFDKTKKYPVIEAIYAGPHGQFVPKEFSPFRSPQQLAELGFIVVRIDGMGTNWRSKAFHDICWKNLKDAGFPDRIAWMKSAAEKYPSMDLSRVGIYGGSAGGQNAMRAVLDHADFYKAAAADCGCHDNRMDKVWWNEAWMGWPVDESYERSSNTVDAHKLNGKLLLTVGMLDRNVDPSSTLQVVEELIKADKDFEFIPFPSLGHGAGESEYGIRRREEFFVRHLLATPEPLPPHTAN